MAWIPNDENVGWDDWKSMALRLYASLGTRGFELFDAGRRSQIQVRSGQDARSLGAGPEPRRRTAPAPGRSSRRAPARLDATAVRMRADLSGARTVMPTRHGSEISGCGSTHSGSEAEAVSCADLNELTERDERDALALAPPVEAIASTPASARPSRRSRTSPAGGQARAWSTRSTGTSWATRSRSASPRVGVHSQDVPRPRRRRPGQSGEDDVSRTDAGGAGDEDPRRHQQTCCRAGRQGLVCPLLARCGYQRQMQGDKPEVWVTAHDMLFHAQTAFGRAGGGDRRRAACGTRASAASRTRRRIEWRCRSTA